MFNLKEFVVDGLVIGYTSGTFSRPYLTIMATSYLMSGMITQEDIEEVNQKWDDWEKEQAEKEQAENTPVTLPELPEDELEKEV